MQASLVADGGSDKTGLNYSNFCGALFLLLQLQLSPDFFTHFLWNELAIDIKWIGIFRQNKPYCLASRTRLAFFSRETIPSLRQNIIGLAVFCPCAECHGPPFCLMKDRDQFPSGFR